MRFKKRIENTKRGYRILAKYCPGLIRAKVLQSIAKTIAPFVTIGFSARIINEITNDRNVDRLILYVLLTIGINFILSMIKNSMEKKVNDKESGMWNYFSKVFSDKQMEMDYVDLEDPDIRKQKQKAEENLFMFGNGLGQLVWDTSGLVEVFIGIAASIALTVSFFTSKSGNALVDSPVWIGVLLIVVILSGFITSKLKAKEQENDQLRSQASQIIRGKDQQSETLTSAAVRESETAKRERQKRRGFIIK